MITYLKGILAYKGETLDGKHFFVIEAGGIGYQVYTTSVSFGQAPPANEPIIAYTSLIVREDSMQLVGFLTREEQELFNILETVSGIGIKVSLSLMSSLSASELTSAVLTGDYKRLTSAKGVGPKLAQKISIELKDKISNWRKERVFDTLHDTLPGESISRSDAFCEAESVLLSLGYSIEEIHRGLQQLQKNTNEFDSLSAEEVLQHILKWLAVHSA